MDHLLGLNAWVLIGLSEYECFGPSGELDLKIRPNKDLGPSLENWANDGPCIALDFLDQELGLGLGPIMDRVKWQFSLGLGY